MIGNLLYRYETVNIGNGPFLRLDTYRIERETPSGYWISVVSGIKTQELRWMGKRSRHRFAWPTENDALKSYGEQC